MLLNSFFVVGSGNWKHKHVGKRLRMAIPHLWNQFDFFFCETLQWSTLLQHSCGTLFWGNPESWKVQNDRKAWVSLYPSIFINQPRSLLQYHSPYQTSIFYHILSYFCIPLFINQKMGLSQNAVPQISRLIIIFPIKIIISEPNLNLFDNTNNI